MKCITFFLFFHASTVVQGLLINDIKPDDVVAILDHVTKLEQTINDLQTEQNSTQKFFNSLSSEIIAMKAEMRLREDEFAKVTSDLKNLHAENDFLRSHLNSTVLDSIGSDVKACLSELHRHVNSTSAAFQVVRGEISSVQEDIQNASSDLLTIHDKLDRFDLEIDGVRNKTTEINQTGINMCSIFESDLRSTQLDVNATLLSLQDIQNEMTVLKSGLPDYSQALNSSAKGLNIYYQVQLQSDTLVIGTGTTIVLDDVLVNVGDGYNSTTGVFTAPVTGTYLLWAHVLGVSLMDSVVDIFLYKNGHEIAASYALVSHLLGYNTASITTISELKAGDRMWYSGAFPATLKGQMYSGYGGVLLSV